MITSVTIDSTIQRDETEHITHKVAANYQQKNGKMYLRYREPDSNGTSTLIKYDGKGVKIRRYGAINSQLGIELGLITSNQYQTPFGTFEMETKGINIKWEDQPTLNICIEYELKFESDEQWSHITIKILQ